MTLIQLKYAVTVANCASVNEASKKLFISQPSLTASIHSLEDEIGTQLFVRSKSGIKLTPEGIEFIGYANQVLDQYDLLNSKYILKKQTKKKFSVSMQHYTFAVNAFMEVVKNFGMENYEFEVLETKTSDIIENVKNRRSEIGVLYVNDFNRKVLEKLFVQADLIFTPLMDCRIYAYMAKSNPLSGKKKVTMKDLENYPCLAFDQGMNNSFYFAEEVLSTYEYKKIIHGNDRATLLNLMKGLNGYTFCSGIICEELNGNDYCAIKLDSDEKMQIGYISRRDSPLSDMGEEYLKKLSEYKAMR